MAPVFELVETDVLCDWGAVPVVDVPDTGMVVDSGWLSMAVSRVLLETITFWFCATVVLFSAAVMSLLSSEGLPQAVSENVNVKRSVTAIKILILFIFYVS